MKEIEEMLLNLKIELRKIYTDNIVININYSSIDNCLNIDVDIAICDSFNIKIDNKGFFDLNSYKDYALIVIDDAINEHITKYLYNLTY